MTVSERCDFNVGDVIDNQYQVSNVLGEGTFGKVFAVTDRYGTVYALKLLRLWEVHPEIRVPLLARFDMEFETGRIQSEYLAHSYNHGFVKGNPYILMEFCNGGDLIELDKKENLNLPLIASHILKGLKALHQNGKVHRDLKPENVLRKANGNYALTDFGISGDRNKRMTERNILGKPKQIFGTYAYMPPEQVTPKRDATVLPTTDIFSFGVMMYQLLTHKLPFGKLENEKDLVIYIKNGKSGNWDRQAILRIPNGFEWMPLLEGCLKPDFQLRFQNIEEVYRHIPHSSHDVQDYAEKENFQTKIINGVLLRIMQGEEYGKVYYLDEMMGRGKSIITVGRMDYGIINDISIKENDSCYISRRHCTLEYDNDSSRWIIRDGQWNKSTMGGWNKSTNGTFVNSSDVGIYGLSFSPGDIISIGDTKLRVEAY